MQATTWVQDIEAGDRWKCARQDSGPLLLVKQALDALREQAQQLFFRHAPDTNDPQTLLQLLGASLAQVLSDLDRVQRLQKHCDAVAAATARAQAMQAVMVEQTQVRMSVCGTEWARTAHQTCLTAKKSGREATSRKN